MPLLNIPLSTEQMLALIIFIATYVLIATGWRERTVATFVGAGAMMLLGILSKEDIVHYVDLDTLGILFGMMILVGALKESGFFGWLGMKLLSICKYDINKFFIMFLLMTAILSAFLDNVTTILFTTVVTLEISRIIQINPIPMIIALIIVSNIGGTATLIGDPPNIMIATYMDFKFMDFIYNVAPASLICTLIVILLMYFMSPFKGESAKHVKGELFEYGEIADKPLFRRSIVVFLGVITVLFLHDFFAIKPVTVALTGALVIMFIGGRKIPEILRNVEWETFLFLAALFVLVGGLEKTGLLAMASQQIIGVAGALGSFVTNSAILWSSGILSAFVDNIPVAAIFIPLIDKSAASLNIPVDELMWALSLGAGFGGNGTIIGSSAGVVAWRLIESHGLKLSFGEFMKTGLKIMFLTLAVANLLIFLKGYCLGLS